MSILSSLGRLIKRIFSTIFKWIKKILGKWWLLLLILVVIYFAPAIWVALAEMGAPAWITGAFEWIAVNASPYLVSAVDFLWSGAGSLLSAAWSGYQSLGFGWQAAIALGAASLLAPEETSAFISDAIDGVADVIGTVAGAVVGGIGSAISDNPWLLLALAAGVWFFFLRDDSQHVVLEDGSDVSEPATNALGDEDSEASPRRIALDNSSEGMVYGTN